VILAGACWLHDKESKRESNNPIQRSDFTNPPQIADSSKVVSQTSDERETGYLVPDNKPTPELPDKSVPLSIFENGFVAVFFGNSVALGKQFPYVVFRQHIKSDNTTEDMLVLDRKNNGIAITGKFFSKDGKIVASLVKNKFFINGKNYFRKEQTEHRLTIFNDEEKVVIDIQYLNRNSVLILGEYYLRNGLPINIRMDEQKFGSLIMSAGSMGGGSAALYVQ